MLLLLLPAPPVSSQDTADLSTDLPLCACRRLLSSKDVMESWMAPPLLLIDMLLLLLLVVSSNGGADLSTDDLSIDLLWRRPLSSKDMESLSNDEEASRMDAVVATSARWERCRRSGRTPSDFVSRLPRREAPPLALAAMALALAAMAAAGAAAVAAAGIPCS